MNGTARITSIATNPPKPSPVFTCPLHDAWISFASVLCPALKSCPNATRPMMSSLETHAHAVGRGREAWIVLARACSGGRAGGRTYVHVEAYSMMFTVAAPPAERTWFVSLLSSCTRRPRSQSSMHKWTSRGVEETQQSQRWLDLPEKETSLPFRNTLKYRPPCP